MGHNEREARLTEAAVAVLAGAPKSGMQITNLNKALFYLDLRWLLDTGETLTRSAYIALAAGPVVAKYPDRLIKPLQRRGLAESDDGVVACPVRLTGQLDEFAYMNEKARESAAKIGKMISSMTAKKISDISHQNLGWTIAYSQRGPNKVPKSIDMRIAMQQLAGHDPWMDSVDEETAASFARADVKGGEIW